MLRFLGGSMILSGCLGMGMWYRACFIGRLRTLRELLRIQELLIGEIRYTKSTLPESCIHVSKRMREPYRSALFNVYHEMRENTGQSFVDVFRLEMENCLEQLPVKEEDCKQFLSLFSAEGFGENGMQIRMIEQSMELLQHTVIQLEREQTEKCRMSIGLGVMSGMLLIIILL